VFGYDADGNVTNDGRWEYMWDGENRLVQMQTVPNLPANVPQQTLLFGYDFQGRRISKVVSNFNGSAWTAVSNLKFVYDGWNLVAELDGNNNPVRTYMWGLDLSGSAQGAGGIGGLLAISVATTGTSFVAYDGNGNVTTLVDADTGEASARYEYGPFGEVIRADGTAAKGNPFRFSTKYTDPETRLLYYGYRYYSPSVGRWPNRDPIGEPSFEARRNVLPSLGWSSHRPAELAEGPNLYVYVGNNAIDRIDPLGLDWLDCMSECIQKNDPLGCKGKLLLSLAGGSWPKWLLWARGGVAGGGSRLTTIPSRISLGWGGGNWLRVGGQLVNGVWLGYGLGMAGIEAICAVSCAGNSTTPWPD
jgi:RHS repeat-associated protein